MKSALPGLAACLAAAGARADLPPGFTRTLIASNVGTATALAPLPDGRLLSGERFGGVHLVGAGQPSILLLRLPDVVTTFEHGLLGLAIAPDFPATGHFFVYYTAPGPYNLVARYTLDNNAVDPGSRVVIWQNPGLCPGESHQGGGIGFGPDGNLYIATGDQFDNPSNAQDLSNHHGKILRLAPDGSIPPDNPFISTPGAQPAIWALGLRNPFRTSIDPAIGSLWIADVGDGAAEEIDRGAAAANYGWPYMEGPICGVPSCAAFTGPVFHYLHGDPLYAPNGEAAVIVGPRYHATAFPAEYRGNLFYADFVNGWIRRLVLDPSGAVIADLPFDTPPTVAWIVDLKLGADGALYYAQLIDNSSGPGGVYRIAAAVPGNQPPVVVAAADPIGGDPPLSVAFSSDGTHDPDNGPQPLSFLWSFGDGQTSTLAAPIHEYASRGLYQARLTASDGADQSVSPPIAITVGHAPVARMTVEGPSPYSAGDTIFFTGEATDDEDGPLPPSAFSWSIVLVHLGHVHPVLGPINGVTIGSFMIPSEGHDPEHTHYGIDLTVRDSDGIPATVRTDLVPREAPISIDTEPPGIPVLLDGRALATPRLYGSLAGFHHRISAQPAFVIGGVTYGFVRWSDGHPAMFEFTAPGEGLSLTALYSPACYANCDGSTIPPVLNVNDFVCFQALFAAADPGANCDGSTMPPVLNVQDFVCFLGAFAAGCP